MIKIEKNHQFPTQPMTLTQKEARGGDKKWQLKHLEIADTFTSVIIPRACEKAGTSTPGRLCL
jgi:hypothetical protein